MARGCSIGGVGRALGGIARPGRGVLMLAAGIMFGAGGYAVASDASRTIHGCIDNHTRLLHVQKRRCKRGQTGITWNREGPAGPAGKDAVSLWLVAGAGGEKLAGTVNVSRASAGQYDLTGPPPPTPTQLCAVTVTPAATNFGGQGITSEVGPSSTGYVVYLTEAGSGQPIDDNFSAIIQC